MCSFLSIASVNCNGLGDMAKRMATFTFLQSLPSQIFLLQETHSTPDLEKNWATEWKAGPAIFNSNPQGGSSRGGVAILIKAPLQIVTQNTDESGRVITADVNTLTHKIHIVNIYAPNTNKTKKDNPNFFKKLYPFYFLDTPLS